MVHHWTETCACQAWPQVVCIERAREFKGTGAEVTELRRRMNALTRELPGTTLWQGEISGFICPSKSLLWPQEGSRQTGILLKKRTITLRQVCCNFSHEIHWKWNFYITLTSLQKVTFHAFWHDWWFCSPLGTWLLLNVCKATVTWFSGSQYFLEPFLKRRGTVK